MQVGPQEKILMKELTFSEYLIRKNSRNFLYVDLIY